MKESKKVPEHQPNLRPIEVNANNSCEKSALHLLDENQNRATQATLRTGRSHHQDQEQENTSAALLQPEVLLQSSSNDVRQELCVQECDTSLQESGTSPVLSRHVAANDFVNSSDVKMSQDLKAKEKTRRLNKNAMNVSAENLHRSVEDVSSSSKKKAFRTSLKNLFHRKKGSIILDELEREYTRQLVRQTLAPHADDKTTMVGADPMSPPPASIRPPTTTVAVVRLPPAR
ncbi:hypothetical protein C0Q70_13173 [Pomacea canaliculata]|uniref:Uncharacterized protein n=1 Tax=Pomacea canaliculata TaxID=400727 RepID=A0A2T7NWI5_POMCA|nr:hypothetical protein C0Q70_13173 [Pomacea canaliculata]